jgi:hypothetical protein
MASISDFNPKSLFDYVHLLKEGDISFFDLKNVINNLKITTTDQNIKEIIKNYSKYESISYKEYLFFIIVFATWYYVMISN